MNDGRSIRKAGFPYEESNKKGHGRRSKTLVLKNPFVDKVKELKTVENTTQRADCH